ncbi:MAG TPA: hypothetical protein VK017_10895 [Sphingobacterium sp.]|jgi:hypothetical protein|nr:hypothetical protein [Sphingobacterium sp.]
MDITNLSDSQLDYIIEIVDHEHAYYFQGSAAEKPSLRPYFYQQSADGTAIRLVDQAAFNKLPPRIKRRIQDLIFRVQDQEP